jgi:hypothetical protein
MLAENEAYSEAPEGVWRTTIARALNPLDELLQIADVDSVVLRIFRSSGQQGDDVPMRSYALAPIDVLFDVEQADAWWDSALNGGDGYNFRHTLKLDDASLPGSDQLRLPGGETYILEYELVTLEWGPLFIVHNARVTSILSR